MAVKVNDGDGTVGPVDGPQQGKGNGVVATKSNDTGQSFALDGGTPLVRICRRRARKDLEVAFLNLLESPGIVVSIDYQCQVVLLLKEKKCKRKKRKKKKA